MSWLGFIFYWIKKVIKRKKNTRIVSGEGSALYIDTIDKKRKLLEQYEAEYLKKVNIKKE